MSQTDENPNTKDKLIQTGIRLFSKYGYEATSMRMIAKDAGVNIASIAFYFGNKQNFYKSVLEFAVNDTDPFFDKFYKKFITAKEIGNLSKNEAWDLICELLNSQLYIAINQPWPNYIALLYWEQIQPPNDRSPISEKITSEIEDALSFLLTQYEPSLDYRKATIISRFINGGIIAFCEHPGFTKAIKERIGIDTSEDFIKYTLKQFISSSIEKSSHI